nr:hypothetical protein Y41E3.5 - Caenorhabditis elegans [Caenorhabditis elegans]
MSKAEFQKFHDEMKALKNAGKHDEFAKKFAAKDVHRTTPRSMHR